MMENLMFKEKGKETSYEQRLGDFYDNNSLNLDTTAIIDNVEKIRSGKNVKSLNDFIINDDLVISSSESSRVVIACKKTGDEIFISKENDLTDISTNNILEIESFLQSKNFHNRNVLLPTEIIKSDDKKVFRLYEAGDTDLEKYLGSKKTLSDKDRLSIIIRVCDGVESLHKIGIANIDLAPLNIIIKKNEVKITDIDSAGIDYDDSGKFITSSFTKNRFLSAPELFKPGNTVDKTVDIYSVSCILYKLFCGDWPYNIEKYCRDHGVDANSRQKLYEFLHNSNSPIFPEDTEADIKRIITKGMDKNPQNRYTTMRELISDLMDVYNK